MADTDLGALVTSAPRNSPPALQPIPGQAPGAAPTQTTAAPAPAAAASPEEESLFQEWMKTFQQPEVRAALAQFGIQALQPKAPGQSTVGHLASAAAAGGEAAGRVTAAETAAQTLAEKQRIERENIRVQDEATQARRDTSAAEITSRENIAAGDIASREALAETRAKLDLDLVDREAKNRIDLLSDKIDAEMAAARLLADQRNKAAERLQTATDERERRIAAADDARLVREMMALNARQRRLITKQVELAQISAGKAFDKPLVEAFFKQEQARLDLQPVGAPPPDPFEQGKRLQDFLNAGKGGSREITLTGVISALRQSAAGTAKREEDKARLIEAGVTPEMMADAEAQALTLTPPPPAAATGGTPAAPRTGETVDEVAARQATAASAEDATNQAAADAFTIKKMASSVLHNLEQGKPFPLSRVDVTTRDQRRREGSALDMIAREGAEREGIFQGIRQFAALHPTDGIQLLRGMGYTDADLNEAFAANP